METPSVDGFDVVEEIGLGGCGRVYHVIDENGEALALKVFDEMAINAVLLDTMTRRLDAGSWPEGVIRVVSRSYLQSPAFHATPLVTDPELEAAPVTRSLQHALDDHPGLDTWKLVKSLARALAGMHEREVVHGNLKPGNILLDDNGDPLLTDWCLGNMPGVEKFKFTDAVLYQAPEQLENPDGILERAGFRWDVFSFGVIAFRLLTGRFPRCHETFNYVAPPPGETRRDGLKADLGKITRSLVAQREITWPDDALNPLEKGFRRQIDRCLALDAERRPVNMVDVAAAFESVEKESAGTKERESLMDMRRKAEHRAWRSTFVMGGAIATAIVFAGLWHLKNSQIKIERARLKESEQAVALVSEEAVRARNAAEARAVEAVQTLAYERDRWLARIEASRFVSDRLFTWAMEKGHRRLPPLDGRELRLRRLERYFEDFLTKTARIDSLADERAMARLQLAEISLAAGDAKGATARLDESLDAWSNLSMDADLKLRMATNSLLLALLRQSDSDPATDEAFTDARDALAKVPRTEVDTDRLDQLVAILDFQEARFLAGKGDDTRALEQLMRATQTLNRISEQRPESAVLRSELAACYLSSATILDGMGSLGDAREVRTLAAGELTRLLKANPKDSALRLELAGCYGAMAEAAVLSGDIAGAESLSRATMKLLSQLLSEQPDHSEALSRKAAQLGLRAGIQRDRGLSAEAVKDYDEGIRILEGIRVSAEDNAMASYRLALLWWQKGRMLGMAGKRGDEIKFLKKSGDLLKELEAEGSTSGPRPEQLQRSGAYLLGDLGHAYQLADKKEESIRTFGEAVHLWESLQSSRPQSEEYSEGLAWCRQRLEDVK